MTGPILPFYLVVDQSSSMGHAISVMNVSLGALLDASRDDPMVAKHIRFEIIGFSDEASVVLPLSDLADISAIPPLRAGGGTAYGPAFRLLRREIELAVRELRRQEVKVYRPIVFFVTDGSPTDHDWLPAYEELIQSSQHPNIIAFGIGDADFRVLSSIATHGVFKSDRSTGTVIAVEELLSAMTRSITLAGSSMDTGPTILTPQSVPGFERVLPPSGDRPERTSDQLTARERTILQLKTDGVPNSAIAARFVMSERTLERVIANIRRKLRLDSSEPATYTQRIPY